jgi:hypothetical protein
MLFDLDVRKSCGSKYGASDVYAVPRSYLAKQFDVLPLYNSDIMETFGSQFGSGSNCNNLSISFTILKYNEQSFRTCV